jgi:Zn-dependent protease with chaperone function
MLGILLYILTLILELVSVICRFGLVALPVLLIWGTDTGLIVGGVAAAAPVVYSVLIVMGMPGITLVTRLRLHARAPTSEERERIATAFNHVLSSDEKRPTRIFIIEQASLNAMVIGKTLFVMSGTLYSRCLPAILAHELGHLNSMDGRLVQAIRVLVIPGAFLVSSVLLVGLQLVQKLAVHVVVLLIIRLRLFAFVTIIKFLFNLLLVRLPQAIIIFSTGGVGPFLLNFLWANYLRNREYDADAYAANHGQRD